MGVVYLAHDRERAQDVALKTLREIDAPTLLHFKREFRSLAGISHPNLVSLYELFHVGDQWFFTMEIAEGVSFNEWVRPSDQTTLDRRPEPPTVIDGFEAPEADRTIDQALATIDDGQLLESFGEQLPPLDTSRFRDAFRQLVEGVHALHRAGRLHRDLKPSNVRVLPSGRVVILDFGLVAELGPNDEHIRTSDRVVGTAGYMAPEQGQGQSVGPPADWYAVGSMIYEALTATRPFVGPVIEVLLEKAKVDGPHPRFKDPSLPEDIADLTAQLLRREPAQRPKGAAILRVAGGTEGRTLMFRDRPGPGVGRALVGRDVEVRQLHDAFLATDQQQSMTVWVRGDSGLGKSALVQHFLDSLGTVGNAVVLRGACHEHETVRYRAFDAVVDSLARFLSPIHSGDIQDILPPDTDALVRLFPVLRVVPAIDERVKSALAGVPTGGSEPREVQLRAFRALRALLAALARRMAVVVWIDDLQWGDKDSAPLFFELLCPPDAPHIMLIGSYRSDTSGAGALVEALENAADGALSEVRTIDLDPLSFTEARQLALRLLDVRLPDPEGLATAVARESGGNPHFVVELLRHLGEDGESGAARLDSDGTGRAFSRSARSANITLDEVVAARVSLLPDEARQLLEVIAVATKPLSFELVFEATPGTQKPEVALRLLESGSFVRTSLGHDGEERVEPYHPRVRDAVQKGIDVARKRTIHGRLATALQTRRPGDAEALALHFFGADQLELARRYAERAAGMAAEGLAFERAAELYALATDGVAEPDQDLRRRRAEALANAGRGLDAAELYLMLARELPAGSDGLDLRRRAAEQLLRTGHVDRGVEVLEHVLDDIGLSLTRAPKRALASLVRSRMAVRLRGLRFSRTKVEDVPKDKLARVDVLWAVATGLAMVDTTLGADFQSRHLVEALQIGEPYRVARALAMEACYSATGGVGTRRRTSKVVALASELAEAIDDPHALGLAEMAKGAAAFLEGRFAEGRQHTKSAEALLRDRCRGVLWEIATAQVFHVLSLVFLGEFGALETFVRTNVREAEGRGDRYATANLVSGGGNLAFLVRDDVDGAGRVLDATRGHLPQDGFSMPHFYELIARVNLLLYQGRAAAAFRAVDEVRAQASKSVVLRVQYLRIDVNFLYGRAALAASAYTKVPEPYLIEVSDRADRLLRERATWAHPLGLVLRAGVIERRGRVKEAIDAHEAAAAAAERQGLQHIHHSARLRSGSLTEGEAGAAMVRDALGFFRSQRVVRPARMANTFAPATFVRE